jgi:hypothetical protein
MLYRECLTIAAHWDIGLDCEDCHLEFDRGGRLTMDDDRWISEAEGSAELVHAIFFWPDELFSFDE